MVKVRLASVSHRLSRISTLIDTDILEVLCQADISMARSLEPEFVGVDNSPFNAQERLQLLDVFFAGSSIVLCDVDPVLAWVENLRGEFGVILQPGSAIHGRAEGVERIDVAGKVSSGIEWSEVCGRIVCAVDRRADTEDTVQCRRETHRWIISPISHEPDEVDQTYNHLYLHLLCYPASHMQPSKIPIQPKKRQEFGTYQRGHSGALLVPLILELGLSHDW